MPWSSAWSVAIGPAPVQFGAQELVVVVITRVQQRYGLVREPDAQHLVIPNRPKLFAVAYDMCRGIGAGIYANLDRARQLQNQRPIAQCVGTDWHHYEGVHVRLNDRAAAG